MAIDSDTPYSPEERARYGAQEDKDSEQIKAVKPTGVPLACMETKQPSQEPAPASEELLTPGLGPLTGVPVYATLGYEAHKAEVAAYKSAINTAYQRGRAAEKLDRVARIATLEHWLAEAQCSVSKLSSALQEERCKVRDLQNASTPTVQQQAQQIRQLTAARDTAQIQLNAELKDKTKQRDRIEELQRHLTAKQIELADMTKERDQAVKGLEPYKAVVAAATLSPSEMNAQQVAVGYAAILNGVLSRIQDAITRTKSNDTKVWELVEEYASRGGIEAYSREDSRAVEIVRILSDQYHTGLYTEERGVRYSGRYNGFVPFPPK